MFRTHLRNPRIAIFPCSPSSASSFLFKARYLRICRHSVKRSEISSSFLISTFSSESPWISGEIECLRTDYFVQNAILPRRLLWLISTPHHPPSRATRTKRIVIRDAMMKQNFLCRLLPLLLCLRYLALFPSPSTNKKIPHRRCCNNIMVVQVNITQPARYKSGFTTAAPPSRWAIRCVMSTYGVVYGHPCRYVVHICDSRNTRSSAPHSHSQSPANKQRKYISYSTVWHELHPRVYYGLLWALCLSVTWLVVDHDDTLYTFHMYLVRWC